MAGLAGILYTIVFSGDLVSPNQGDSLLIFAFIVVVIGGLGSIRGFGGGGADRGALAAVHVLLYRWPQWLGPDRRSLDRVAVGRGLGVTARGLFGRVA